MDTSALEQHITLTSSTNIQDICRPLREHFGITSFVYQRNYTDCSEIRLSNQPKWVKHFYQQDYFLKSTFETIPSNYTSGYVLWKDLTNHSEVLGAAREHGIDHGITLLVKKNDGCEFYFFGTTPDNASISEFYLANVDLLERFILYFQDKAATLISKAVQDKIVIPNKFERVREPGTFPILVPSESRDAFIQDTPINKLHLPDKTSLTSLSKREIDCLVLLLQGKTLKEIAEILFRSARTIEAHINNVKIKLKCRTKSELISKLLSLGFNKDGHFSIITSTNSLCSSIYPINA